MITYKIDILKALSDKGYTTYVLRKNYVLSESTIQGLRVGKLSLTQLNRICAMLNCQPSDLIEYVPDELDLEPIARDLKHERRAISYDPEKREWVLDRDRALPPRIRTSPTQSE